MQVIADLHIHSRFSRAVSQNMILPVIDEWARKKGIGLVSCADFTHPIWSREIKSQLVEVGEGVYKLNSRLKTLPAQAGQNSKLENDVKFLLSTEISSIYREGGKVRRIHTLIFAPNFETVEKINKELTLHGANLFSDGRPILGLSAKAITEIAFSASSKCLIIPAHAWTPWFSIFGSLSGFDSIEECFGSLAKEIYAIETGLSSDPAMNWRVEELENRKIVSFSDAHSPQKLGREATVFKIIQNSKVKNQNYKSKFKITYNDIYDAIKGNPGRKLDIAYTIEFYPEEGKYHFSGHRNCNIVYSPGKERKMGRTCPVCGRPLTVGVMSRVEQLAKKEIEAETVLDEFGVRWIMDKAGKRPKYVTLVPLAEVIAESMGVGVGSKGVSETYESLIKELGGEFNLLLHTKLEDLKKITSAKIIEGIRKTRIGDIVIEPGYDGVFGKVNIWPESIDEFETQPSIDQSTLF